MGYWRRYFPMESNVLKGEYGGVGWFVAVYTVLICFMFKLLNMAYFLHCMAKYK